MSVHVSKAPLPGAVTELTAEWLSAALSSEWPGHTRGYDVIPLALPTSKRRTHTETRGKNETGWSKRFGGLVNHGI